MTRGAPTETKQLGSGLLALAPSGRRPRGPWATAEHDARGRRVSLIASGPRRSRARTRAGCRPVRGLRGRWLELRYCSYSAIGYDQLVSFCIQTHHRRCQPAPNGTGASGFPPEPAVAASFGSGGVTPARSFPPCSTSLTLPWQSPHPHHNSASATRHSCLLYFFSTSRGSSDAPSTVDAAPGGPLPWHSPAPLP